MPVSVEVSQFAGRVVALRPVGSVWPSGHYAISLHRGADVQGIAFCVR